MLFRIGSFEINSFGALLAIAALVALWFFQRELQRARVPPNATHAAFAGIFAGLLGAKLRSTVEFFRRGTVPFRCCSPVAG